MASRIAKRKAAASESDDDGPRVYVTRSVAAREAARVESDDSADDSSDSDYEYEGAASSDAPASEASDADADDEDQDQESEAEDAWIVGSDEGESSEDEAATEDAWLRSSGVHWREQASRRQAGLDVDESKNTYAHFAALWLQAAAAVRDDDIKRARELIQQSWQTYAGRPLSERIERFLHTFGQTSSGSKLVRERLDRMRREGEVGRLRVRRLLGDACTDMCAACGSPSKHCTGRVELRGRWLPLGGDCAAKMRPLAALYAHLRRGDGSEEARGTTRQLLAALDQSELRFNLQVEDLAAARNRYADDREYVGVRKIAKIWA